jgi:hypothetical protein
MRKTTRRHLLKAAAVGGVTATGLSAALGAEQKPGNGSEHAHDNRPLSGKRALAVVSFGQWDANATPPFDRDPINTDLENRIRNVHKVLPFESEIDAGGAVSFTISGVHQILIYSGTDYDTLRAAFIAAGSPSLPPSPPGLVNYPAGQVYRGLNPFALNYLPLDPMPAGTASNLVVDRVESVNFKTPGRYLVVCGVVPHFLEGMYGYIDVKA